MSFSTDFPDLPTVHSYRGNASHSREGDEGASGEAGSEVSAPVVSMIQLEYHPWSKVTSIHQGWSGAGH